MRDGNLASLIASEGALPVRRAVGIAQQVADGLTFLHEAGIIHNDLKPANILLRREAGQDNIAKLTDFGTSQLRDHVLEEARVGVTREGFIFPTFRSFAPELFHGEHPTHVADIYGLGVVLYNMLTGLEPYEAVMPFELMKQICLEDLVAPHARRPDLAIPDALSKVVSKAMAKPVKERFQSAAEFKDALLSSI